MIKVSISNIENLALGDYGETRDGVELDVVEEYGWVSEGKYEVNKIIFTDGERFYSGTAMRTGSYFTEYTYTSEWDDGNAEITEVRKVTKTIEAWEAV